MTTRPASKVMHDRTGTVSGKDVTLPERESLETLRGTRRLFRHIGRVVANVGAGGFLVPKRVRNSLLRLAGIRVGERVAVFSGCLFRDLNVIFSDHCFVNYRCVFDAAAPVVLEPDVFVGPGVTFTTSTHAVGDRRQRAGTLRAAPIRVGRGSWIGANATILAGVSIGEGCIVASGAVVTRDCDPDGLYTGVPATRKQDLDAGSG